MVEKVVLWKDRRGGTHKTAYDAHGCDIKKDMQDIVSNDDMVRYRGGGNFFCPTTVADFILKNSNRIMEVLEKWKKHDAAKFNPDNLRLPGREKDD